MVQFTTMNKAALITLSTPGVRIPHDTLAGWEKLFFGKWVNAFDTVYVADIGWQVGKLPPNVKVLKMPHQYPHIGMQAMFNQVEADLLLLLNHRTIIYDYKVIDRAVNYAKKYDVIGFEGFSNDYLWIKHPILKVLTDKYGFYDFTRISSHLSTVKNLALKKDTSRVTIDANNVVSVSNPDAPKTGVYTANEYDYGLELYGEWLDNQYAYQNKRRYFKDKDVLEGFMWMHAAGADVMGIVTQEEIAVSTWQNYHKKFTSHHDWLKKKPAATKA